MRIVLLALSLIAVSARGADTPLSAILIDGEGWKEGPPTNDYLQYSGYYTRKDAKGRWGVYHPYLRDVKQPLALAAEGETLGSVIVSPGWGQLVVAVPSHHHLYCFQIKADGTLTAKEKTYVLRREKPGKGGSNVGSLVFDSKGRLYAAMPEGVQFFDEEMRFSGQLSRPERAPVTSVRFGGLKGDELYILCGDKPWRRKIRAIVADPVPSSKKK